MIDNFFKNNKIRIMITSFGEVCSLPKELLKVLPIYYLKFNIILFYL